MKTAIKIFLLLAVVGYLVVAVWKFGGQAEDRICEGVRVEIIDSIPDGFITDEYVRSILTRNKRNGLHSQNPKNLSLIKCLDMSVFTNLESDSQLFKTDSDAVKPKSVFMFFWKEIVICFS